MLTIWAGSRALLAGIPLLLLGKAESTGVLYFSSFQLEQAACNCGNTTTELLYCVPLSCIKRQKRLCRGDVDFAYSNFAIGDGLREFDPMCSFKEETTALQIGAITTRIFKAQSLNKVKVWLLILAPIMRISESVTDGCQPYLCPLDCERLTG